MLSLVLVCLLSGLFIPSIQAFAANSVGLTVKQSFLQNGVKTSTDKICIYKLTAQKSSNPMPTGSNATDYTFNITGVTSLLLPPITFTTPGEYIYELRCITASDTNYTISSKVYTIEFYVASSLQAVTIVYGSDGAKVSEIAFEHTYTPSSPVYIDDYVIAEKTGGKSIVKDMGGSGTYTYSPNEPKVITVIAQPDKGYKFIGWYDKDDNLVSTASPFTLKEGDYKYLESRFEKVNQSVKPAPKTGDFNAWAIGGTSLIAILGLSYVFISRKKKQNNK